MELYLAGNIRKKDVELGLLKYNRLYSFFYSTGKHNSHDFENRIKKTKKGKQDRPNKRKVA